MTWVIKGVAMQATPVMGWLREPCPIFRGGHASHISCGEVTQPPSLLIRLPPL